MRNAAFRINGLSVSNWHDELNTKRLKMEIVKIFKIYISNNVMQRKRDRKNLEKSSNHFEKNISKDLKKGF
jgi:hypothetical protein